VDDLNWDQFETNKMKFKVDTDYKEELYTTELDKEQIPEDFKKNAENIEKVVKINISLY
jgi:PAB1-binding protein PBP1